MCQRGQRIVRYRESEIAVIMGLGIISEAIPTQSHYHNTANGEKNVRNAVIKLKYYKLKYKNKT